MWEDLFLVGSDSVVRLRWIHSARARAFTHEIEAAKYVSAHHVFSPGGSDTSDDAEGERSEKWLISRGVHRAVLGITAITFQAANQGAFEKDGYGNTLITTRDQENVAYPPFNLVWPFSREQTPQELAESIRTIIDWTHAGKAAIEKKDLQVTQLAPAYAERVWRSAASFAEKQIRLDPERAKYWRGAAKGARAVEWYAKQVKDLAADIPESLLDELLRAAELF